MVTGTEQHRRHPAGQRHCRRQCAGGHRGFASDGSINYTAPAVVPTPSNVVQLTITSVDNPTVSITQNISVMNPIPILTVGHADDFERRAAIDNRGADRAEIHYRRTGAGERLAGYDHIQQRNAVDRNRVSPTEPGNLDLQVLNPSPGPATSADLIATVGSTPPTPVVSADRCRALPRAGNIWRNRCDYPSSVDDRLPAVAQPAVRRCRTRSMSRRWSRL